MHVQPIHYGCIMAFNTFEQNETSGVTCKECIMKSGHLVWDILFMRNNYASVASDILSL